MKTAPAVERGGRGVFMLYKHHVLRPFYQLTASESSAKSLFFRSLKGGRGSTPSPLLISCSALAADDYQEQLNEPHRHLLWQEAHDVF